MTEGNAIGGIMLTYFARARIEVLMKQASRMRDRLPECRKVSFAKRKMRRQIREES